MTTRSYLLLFILVDSIKHIDEFVNDWARKDRKKSTCLECHR